MRDRRVVVTGLGAVTPIGNDLSSYWEALLQGKSGAGRITKFDTEGFTSKIACEVKGFDVEQFVDPKEARRMDPFTQYGIAASDQALEDSGLDLEKENLDRIGVLVGCGIGGMQVYHEEHRKLLEKGPRRVSPLFIPMMIPDIVAGHISIRHGLKGPNYNAISACASGSHALGLGLMHIERGDADLMLVGGTEGVITEMAVAGFCSAKTLSTRNDDPTHASRPFDKERDGFVMGEGAGMVVLEELSHALARGAKIYAEFAGLGFSGDAYHITAPHFEGDGAIRAMKASIANAELNPEDVDYVNAHGTSTALNDKTETLAMRQVFQDHAKKLQVSSCKSMIGHLLGASGAVEFVATSMAIKNSKIPPTINYEVPDPECDMDYVPNEARDAEINVAISNSFGFGGHNASLCLKKFKG